MQTFTEYLDLTITHQGQQCTYQKDRWLLKIKDAVNVYINGGMYMKQIKQCVNAENYDDKHYRCRINGSLRNKHNCRFGTACHLFKPTLRYKLRTKFYF